MQGHAHTQDPRGRRTRAQLHGALMRLLEDRTIRDITVSELCREANIHRTTFYKHYADVPDFVRHQFTDILDELIGVPLNSRFSFTDTPAVYREAASRVFAAVVQDRAVYRRLLGPEGDPGTQWELLEGLRARFTSAAENCLRFTGLPIDPQAAGAAIAGAAFSLAERLTHDETADVEATVDVWFSCLPGWFAGGWGNRPGDLMYRDGAVG